MPTTFTPADIAALLEDGWEDEGGVYIKRTIIQLGCGCCSDVDVLILSKQEDGTFHVGWRPCQGSWGQHEATSLTEAMNYF